MTLLDQLDWSTVIDAADSEEGSVVHLTGFTNTP